MAVRVRRPSGEVVCAAMHPAEEGDCYLDDGLHYLLSAELGVLVTEDMHLPEGVGRGGHAAHGEWWWRGRVPEDVELGRFYTG